jgi:hypothetical protein
MGTLLFASDRGLAWAGAAASVERRREGSDRCGEFRAEHGGELVAQRHGLHRNQLHAWRRELQEAGCTASAPGETGSLPLSLLLRPLDVGEVGKGERNLVLSGEVDKAGQVIPMPQIVGIAKRQPLGSCRSNPGQSRPRGTGILNIDQPDRRPVSADALSGVIGRPVVDNDNFGRSVILPQDAVESTFARSTGPRCGPGEQH